ncbi:hypothetical protein BDV93DRAFT_519671 [Ceratobasidium sp. AG-I]|nr:hypothetical protein BDV93DRAFT_519671 [Ceratobasidium sp. AG-I]
MEVKQSIPQEEERRCRMKGFNPLTSRAGSAPPMNTQVSMPLDSISVSDSVARCVSPLTRDV